MQIPNASIGYIVDSKYIYWFFDFNLNTPITEMDLLLTKF